MICWCKELFLLSAVLLICAVPCFELQYLVASLLGRGRSRNNVEKVCSPFTRNYTVHKTCLTVSPSNLSPKRFLGPQNVFRGAVLKVFSLFLRYFQVCRVCATRYALYMTPNTSYLECVCRLELLTVWKYWSFGVGAAQQLFVL